MDTFSTEIEVPEPAYCFSHYNEEGVLVSYGPKNGLLWLGEAFDKEMHLMESLNKVFTRFYTE